MTNKYINGFIAGGLIGAAATMMIASKSGGDMKKRMAGSSKAMADAATKFIPGMKSR